MTAKENDELSAQIDDLFRQGKTTAEVIRLTDAPYPLVNQRRKNLIGREDRKARKTVVYLRKLAKASPGFALADALKAAQAEASE